MALSKRQIDNLKFVNELKEKLIIKANGKLKGTNKHFFNNEKLGKFYA